MLKLIGGRFLCALAVCGLLSASVANARAGTPRYPQVFFDNFESGTAANWEVSDQNAWRIAHSESKGGSVLSQYRNSKVKTPYRSPFNRALIKEVTVGSFIFDVHLQSTKKDYPHRDLCLFFGYQDPAHFYYVHLGKRTDDHANNIFIVNGSARHKISTTTTKGTNWDDAWHRVRISRNVETGSIKVYFDDLQHPVMTATDKTFQWGQVGVGSFDDTGNFDDVSLFAETVNRPKNNVAPKGYYALFNGVDLSGWKGLVGNPKTRAKMTKAQLAKAQVQADARARKHWNPVNGVLVFDGKGKSLCTAKDYGDFDMYVDWKIKSKGDSGIYLRGTPQVQIWDPALRKIGSGGLFNNKKGPSKPLLTADKPIGQWNTFRIRMVGEKVTVWLNGKKVVNNVVLENYWERDKPIYPTGQIELQNHGNTLYFRNIYIKELGK